MKILICSDSHGEYNILNDLYLNNYSITNFLHLGDSCLPEYLMSHFCAVKGNCDFNSLPKYKDIEIGGLKIHMEHGDGFRMHFDMEEYLKDLDCDIFLYGHTHKKIAAKIGKTFVFNPGSLTKPRDGNKGSYLIIEIENKEIKNYEFKEIEL